MARGRRNSRILTAARMKGAVDKYLKYFEDTARQGARVGTGKPRVKSQELYIIPFGLKLSKTQRAKQTGAEPSWVKYKSDFAGHTEDSKPAGEGDVQSLANYYAARVIIIVGRSDKGVATSSNVTGLKYLKYGGTSTSIPFGNSVVPKVEEESYKDIAAKIKAGAASGVRVSHKREVT